MAAVAGGAIGTVSIPVNATLHTASSKEQPSQPVVYAFTSNGRFVTKAAVGRGGESVLNIAAVAGSRGVRVVLGPDLDFPELPALIRRGAVEQFIRVEPGQKPSPVNFAVPPEIWRCWIRSCLVKGRLLKSVFTNGLPVDLPVCGATVQIWEVEAVEIVVSKLPLTLIERLRRIVLDPALGLQTAQPVPAVGEIPIDSPEFARLLIAAQAGNAESFRQSLIVSLPTMRNWLCELIPTFIAKTLVGTTTTDCYGNFETRVFHSCHAVNPNIYLTATLPFILGLSFPILDPSSVARCTHWSYRSGTAITLYTNSIFTACRSEPHRVVNAPAGAAPPANWPPHRTAHPRPQASPCP